MYKIDKTTKPNFEEAKAKEKFMKCKTYAYKLYKGGLLNILSRKGKCKVLERHYEKEFDCDVLHVIDIDTNETFYTNQYAIKLKEAK